MNKEKLKRTIAKVLMEIDNEKQARIILGDAVFENRESGREFSKKKKRLKRQAERRKHLEQDAGRCVSVHINLLYQ